MAIINLIQGGEEECPIEVVSSSGEYTSGSYNYKIDLSTPVKSGSNWTMSVGSYRKTTSATSYTSRSIYYSTYSGANGAAQKVQFKCNKACTIKGSHNVAIALTAGSTYNFYVNRASGYTVYLRIALTSAPTTSKGIIASATNTSSSSCYITVPQTITITKS